MKHVFGALLAAGSLVFAIAALAQSGTSTPPGPSSPPPAGAPIVQANPAPAAPVAASKRFACRAASQALQGQERADQMQLCMAQARMDCLKQAIDQKIAGPQRREFVHTCMDQ